MSTKEEKNKLQQALAEAQAKNVALQQELKWYKQSLEKLPIGLLMMQSGEDKSMDSLRIVASNELSRQSLSEQEDVTGQLYKDAFHYLMDTQLPQIIMQVMESGQLVELPAFPVTSITGDLSYNSITYYPWGDRGVNVLYQDVTKQVEAEKDLEQKVETIEAQQNAIRELSTPIIPIMEQIIVVPLVGHIDSARAKELMRALLAGISEHRAKVVIIDITGVPFVDTGVVNHLDKTIQAARLKGAKTIITGISDVVAETIVDLGIDWHQTQTLRDLQTGLLIAFKIVGVKVQK